MPPITWRNVQSNASQGAVAADLLQSADQSLNRGFDAFRGILDDREALAGENQATLVDNNTQAFRNELAKYRSPEELAQAQADGVFDNLRQQFGRNVDQDLIRDGENERLNTLRERQNATNTFEDQKRDRSDRPIVESVEQLIAKKDWEGARGILAQEGTDPRREAELLERINTGELAHQEFERKETTRKGNKDWDGLMREAIENSPTAFDARQYIQQNAVNIPDSIVFSRMGEIDANFETRHELTTGQSRLLDAEAQQITADRDLEIERLTIGMQAEEEEIARLEQHDLSNVSVKNAGEVVAHALDLGFDPNVWGDDAHEAIEDAITAFNKDLKNDPKYIGIKGAAIAFQAVSRMGQQDGIFVDTDLTKEALLARMKSVWAEHVRFTDRKESLISNRGQHAARIREANKKAANNIAAQLTALKQTNKLLDLSKNKENPSE